MTKKMIEKLHAECIAHEKAELKKLTGKDFTGEDIELIDNICGIVLDLRDKYELGNFETRDCADEINAIMPLIYSLLATKDLFKTKIVEEVD